MLQYYSVLSIEFCYYLFWPDDFRKIPGTYTVTRYAGAAYIFIYNSDLLNLEKKKR